MAEDGSITVEDMDKIFKGQELEVPDEAPILDITNMVLFPFMIAPVIIQKEHQKEMVSDALRGDRLIGFFLRHEEEGEEGEEEKQEITDIMEEEEYEDQDTSNLKKIGCMGMILRMLKIPDGSIRLLVHGIRRIHLQQIIQVDPYMKGRISPAEEIIQDNITVEALVKQSREQLKRAITLSDMPEELGVAAMNVSDPGKLADLIATNLSLKIPEQQTILEMTNTQDRLEKVLSILAREVEVMELGSRIKDKVKSEVEKNQREYLLREQLKAIQKELGEEEGVQSEIEEFKERLEKKDLPEETEKVARKEMKRLETIPSQSPEYTVTRNYVETILDLPWMESTKDNLNIKKAQKVLDEDHYDLEKIKDRILEYLSVVKLKKSIKGPILCFVGPPGVGKTSLGRSIARALNRKFYHFSLGGMRDEAEIRGHRRTYIGAMPGRIINGIKNCECNNPVMMLDEVDKIGADFRGDPASALLEVLDPEQNNQFRDHYLDMPFDLSKVMFITTANILDTIPPPLRDRMEILRLSGYTLQEKVNISRKYLIPKEYEANGVSEKIIEFTDEGLETIAEKYTREAGLRNLQREIGNICRKAARKLAEGQKKHLKVKPDNVSDFLGPPRFQPETAERPPEPGVATGLAWTPTGGQILFIESSATRGKGKLILTGQLGDVMKESAQAALTWLHSKAEEMKIPEKLFSEQDIHVHVPAGAIPKDGPSAGITLCVSLASLLMKKAMKKGLAMTGEITLKGNVLPVGGIKEKVLAAHRAGIREIILPEMNEKDLVEIPDEVKGEIKFHFTKKMDDVIKWCFE